MLSILPYMYDAIAGMTVKFSTSPDDDDVAPTCYGLSLTPASVQTAHVPCRIILSVGNGYGVGSVSVIDAGARITWKIGDLFLFDAVGQDVGARANSYALMTYAANYAEAISRVRQQIDGSKSNAFTLTANITPGVYPYPLGGEAYWFGVLCDVTIEEIL